MVEWKKAKGAEGNADDFQQERTGGYTEHGTAGGGSQYSGCKWDCLYSENNKSAGRYPESQYVERRI